MRLPASVAALAVAAGIGGCSLGSGDGDRRGPAGTPQARRTPVAPPDRTLIAAMLDRRAKALERGRPGEYAGTSVRSRRGEDRAVAGRARGLGLRAVAFRLDDVRVDGDRGRVRARMSYRIRGVPGRFGTPRTISLRRTPGGWRVSRVHGRRQLTPWEAGRFSRARTPHFVVWGPQGVDLTSGGLPAALEAGYERMRAVLAEGTLERRYLVVVAADAVIARRITSQIRGLESLTALTDTEVEQVGPAQRVRTVNSQRVLVLWPGFATIDADAQRTVITHELTHAALAAQTSGRTPGWLTEGLALYVSGDRRVIEASTLLDSLVATGSSGGRRALSLRTLSDPDAIAATTGDDQSAAYAYASAAAFYVAERFGRRRLLDLYDAFNDPRLRGRAGDPLLVDRALRRTLGVGLRRLDRDLRGWLAGQAVGGAFAP